MTKQSTYMERMKAQLDELNANMSALEVKASEARDDARDMYHEELAKLRHQSQIAMAKLADMKAATEESWDTAVAEMENVRDAFVRSFHYFKSQV